MLNINFILFCEQAETSLKKEEIKIREKEAENRRMELEILKDKTEAEIEERKKITDLLIQLASK